MNLHRVLNVGIVSIGSRQYRIACSDFRFFTKKRRGIHRATHRYASDHRDLSDFAGMKIILVLLDLYEKLSPEDQVTVHTCFGKRTLRVVADRLKKNQKYRDTVEDAERIFKTNASIGCPPGNSFVGSFFN